jgi:hypothetical protein
MVGEMKEMSGKFLKRMKEMMGRVTKSFDILLWGR